MEKLVLVNKRDQVLGTAEKMSCHKRPGRLHRAFSAFVLDEKNRILLTQRSRLKPLWPLYWENTCSSHPKLGESYTQAGERRLQEELGFTTRLGYLYKFYYQVDYNQDFSEHEVCAVLVGRNSDKVTLNPKEVADFRWLSFEKLGREVSRQSSFVPWLEIIVEKLQRQKSMQRNFFRR